MLGTRVADRYDLVAELGAGAMGRVFRAVDTRENTVVALKVLHLSATPDAEAMARMQREAILGAGLHSPHIVRVLDAGTQDGQPFLVMEFIPGLTLAALLRERPMLPPGEALAILRQIGLGLAAAHERGVVHRDLKPSNVMVDQGIVKVLDFGLARADGDPTLTTTGAYLGTPAYSAPERVEQRGDIRSDIYSAGVIMFRMLAGAPPFEASTPWAVLHAHRFMPPPPLPDTVPRPLQALTLRCLAKDPDDRYRDPEALLAALKAVARVVPELPVLGSGQGDGSARTAQPLAPPPPREGHAETLLQSSRSEIP